MGEFLNYFKKKKNLVNLLILGILILALPLGIELIREQQILKSGATQDPIVFTGDNVNRNPDGTWVALKAQISLLITSTLGPPVQSATRTVQSKNSSMSLLSKGLVETVYAATCTTDCSYLNKGRYCDGSNTKQCTGVCDSQNPLGDPTADCRQDCSVVPNDPLDCGGTPTTQCPSGQQTIYRSGEIAMNIRQGTYLVNEAVVKSDLTGYQGSGECGYRYYKWESTTTDGDLCVTYQFGAWADQSKCPKQGSTSNESEQNISSAGGSAGQCGDNPAPPPPPAGEYKWLADCNSKCNVTTDGKGDPICPKNDFDSYNIEQNTSNWCYDFDPVDAVGNCLKLVRIGCEKAGDPGCTTSPTNSCPAGVVNTCNDCILKNRTDILPYYQKNGWDISCANQNKVVDNWCSIDSTGCSSVKSTQCASSCGGTTNICSGDACKDCVLKNRTDILPFYQKNGWDIACANQGKVVDDWCSSVDPTGCQSVKSGSQCSSVCGATPSNPPTATTVSYRIDESPFSDSKDLDKGWQTYTSDGMTVDYKFKDETPGQKFIFVQFKDSAGKVTNTTTCPKCSAQITLLGTGPTISGCSLNFEGSSTVLTLTGQNFGTTKGSVKTNDGNNTNLSIKSWVDSSVQATWPNSSTGQTLPVTLTNSVGQSIDGSCSAVSQLSLGAKVFCRAPSTHQTNNVDLTLVEASAGGKKIKAKVSIDKDGVIKGLDQKLEVGKNYKLSLKAPRSLRKTVPFTAVQGTTVIPDFTLPVGDIFPADGGDGQINSFDHDELVREWNIAGDATGRSGDFNLDNKVNSFDWACMRYDFGIPENPEPVPGQ